jgi:hypothetical protein
VEGLSFLPRDLLPVLPRKICHINLLYIKTKILKTFNLKDKSQGFTNLKRFSFNGEFFEIGETAKNCERRQASTPPIEGNFSQGVPVRKTFK